MAGTKITASKLGICAVISSLADDDFCDISTFNNRSESITAGFLRVANIRSTLPALLAAVEADGGTACFDAVILALQALRDQEAAAPVGGGGARAGAGAGTEAGAGAGDDNGSGTGKTVLVVLTDGEDTSSRNSTEQVFLSLQRPGLSRFMFVLVAVQMEDREARAFESWMSLRHCKQISVSVRTGARLVSVFKETLMSRVLHSGQERFYQATAASSAAPAPSSVFGLGGGGRLTADALQRLEDQYDDGAGGRMSRCVSRANSDDGGGSDQGEATPVWRTVGTPRSPMLLARSATPLPSGLVIDELENGGPFSYPLDSPRPMRSRSGSDASVSSVDGGRSLVVDGVSYPAECFCPISYELMTDPVQAADGHSYERAAITRWLLQSNKSPLSGAVLATVALTPNHALRNVIETLQLQAAAARALAAVLQP